MKTIHRLVKVLFPIDLNDIQHKIEISNHAESESTLTHNSEVLPVYRGLPHLPYILGDTQQIQCQRCNHLYRKVITDDA